MGNLVTDAIRTKAGSDVALTGNGTIRDELHAGKSGIQTVSDLFRITPLGVGVLDKAGYPLTKMYLNGRDLKGLFEVLWWPTNSKGLLTSQDFLEPKLITICSVCPFDRITDIHLGNEVDGYKLANLSKDSKELYSLAATSYVAKFAWTVEKLSQGVISIVPRDKDGNPVPTVEEAIIDGSTTEEGVQEIKEWEALLEYVLVSTRYQSRWITLTSMLLQALGKPYHCRWQFSPQLNFLRMPATSCGRPPSSRS